jgi:hypothetical protein
MILLTLAVIHTMPTAYCFSAPFPLIDTAIKSSSDNQNGNGISGWENLRWGMDISEVKINIKGAGYIFNNALDSKLTKFILDIDLNNGHRLVSNCISGKSKQVIKLSANNVPPPTFLFINNRLVGVHIDYPQNSDADALINETVIKYGGNIFAEYKYKKFLLGKNSNYYVYTNGTRFDIWDPSLLELENKCRKEKANLK